MQASVIIPAFKTGRLKACLQSLSFQTILPKEVIILSHKDLNVGTILSCAKELNYLLKIIEVKDKNNLTPLLNKALKSVTGSLICFTDPDTAPEPCWLEKIIKTYIGGTSARGGLPVSDKSFIGGVGGRDEIYRFNTPIDSKMVGAYNPAHKLCAGPVYNVGKLTWFGRIIGNHHELLDKSKEVDFLKGCNMSFRRELLEEFDENLLGFYRWEQDMCFKIKAKGYKLIYNPEIRVKHFKEEEKLTAQDFFIISHNTTYLLLKYLSLPRKLIFLFYTFFIGQRNNLGFLRSLLLLFQSPSLTLFDNTLACIQGKLKGIKTYLTNR
ncbi:glycosyltransferase [candidate division WOR-3 bacterium]|nr:glycosyltransferase [candidate division WOR-3 bacterium]